MAADEKTPPPCDKRIFKDGVAVCILDGKSDAIEKWVKGIARLTEAKVNWHYVGGRANVLYLGDDIGYEKVLECIYAFKDELDGSFLHRRKSQKEQESNRANKFNAGYDAASWDLALTSLGFEN